MKTIRLAQLITVALALGLWVPVAYGAGNLPAGAGLKKQRPVEPGSTGALAALTRTEEKKFALARTKALAEDGALAAEELDIRGLRKKVQAGQISKGDALAKMRAHRDRMDAALLRAEPSVGPILNKMKAAMREGAARRNADGIARAR